MGQAPEDIERHIHETRERLEENVSELRARIRSRLDWRSQMQRHPLTSTAVPFALGLMVSLLLGRALVDARRRAKNRSLVAAFAAGQRPAMGHRRLASWDEVIDTLLSMGPQRARTVLSDLLPAFKSYARR